MKNKKVLYTIIILVLILLLGFLIILYQKSKIKIECANTRFPYSCEQNASAECQIYHHCVN